MKNNAAPIKNGDIPHHAGKGVFSRVLFIFFFLFLVSGCATTEVEVRGQYDTVFGKVQRPR